MVSMFSFNGRFPCLRRLIRAARSHTAAQVRNIFSPFATNISRWVPCTDKCRITLLRSLSLIICCRAAVKSLERRLAAVLTQGFDDCPTLRGRFRLLDCFSDLVHRPAIAEELQRKHVLMVQDFAADVATVMQVRRVNKNNVDVAGLRKLSRFRISPCGTIDACFPSDTPRCGWSLNFHK